MSVRARFVMVCWNCQRPVERGDLIVKDERGWMHESCVSLPTESERKRAYAASMRRRRKR